MTLISAACTAPAKVVLIDDHAVVRAGLKELLAGQPDIAVIGEAADATEAVERCAVLRPDLAIVDISLGPDNGLSLLGALKIRAPATRLLVLSMHDEQVFAQRALQAGANGYVSKAESSEQILVAVRRVLAGKMHVSEAMSDMLVQSMVRPSRPTTGPRDLGVSRLSGRELEILEMIGSGLKTGEIAAQLGLSTKTIETHRARMKEKLGLNSSAKLAMFAINWARDGFAGTPGSGA